MFIILKRRESRTKTDTNSRWAKGWCYFGLGLLGVIGIANKEVSMSMEVSGYVAAMCFIEYVDLCFNWGEAHGEKKKWWELW